MKRQVVKGLVCAAALVCGVVAASEGKLAGQEPVGQLQSAPTVAADVDQPASALSTYTNATVTALTDNATTNSTITVGNNGKILDINVRVRINHARDNDLDMFLISPDGTTVMLATDVGSNAGANFGTGANDCNGTFTEFDDEAATFIEANVAPFPGKVRPEGRLANFRGQNGAGTWTLRIADDTAGTAGTLYCWQMTIRRQSIETADGRPSFLIFRPSVNTIYLRFLSNPATSSGVFGQPTDIPVPAAYNVAGLTEITAFFRPAAGLWINTSVGPNIPWGAPGDVPVPADYNGDNSSDIAVWRPSDGTWYVRGLSITPWGAPGDVPVPADYNGDGLADLAVFRPSSGTWFIKDVTTVAWGTTGDIAVPGDYDGDGKADIAIFRPSNGTWYIMPLSGETVTVVAWGVNGDIPVPLDYDGDGKTEIAIWRPSDGGFYIRTVGVIPFGIAGDIPMFKRPTYPTYPF